MKVLMLTTNLDLPEANLMLGLSKLGVEIRLILDRESPFQEVIKDSAIRKEYWKFKNRIDIKSILFLKKIFKEERFDIVHTFSARSLTSALIAGLFSSVKHVTYRGTTGHLSRLDPSSWLSYLNPKVSKIICVSDAVKNYMINQGVAANKLERIYKGHKESWYMSDSKVDRSDFGILDNVFLVGCSANMRPVKGVDLLIKALSLIPDEVDLKAVLIGEVRDSAIESLLLDPKIKSRVILTGFREDATKIIGFCDAFCMPSRKREGLPKALIEAMIQAKPSIITRVGGMPELIKNEEHGLVIEEEDFRGIAAAMLRLYQDRTLGKKLGENARARILSEFTIDNTVNQTFNVYKSLLS